MTKKLILVVLILVITTTGCKRFTRDYGGQAAFTDPKQPTYTVTLDPNRPAE